MLRTKALRASLLVSLVAALAAPSAMAGQYDSLNSVAGPTATGDADRGVESLNAITGPAPSAADGGYQSVNAATGPAPVGGSPSAIAHPGDFSSPNALVGADPAPASFVEATATAGFDWGDALVGALAGTALLLAGLGAFRVAGQLRRGQVQTSA
jgi:hypothetical protein